MRVFTPQLTRSVILWGDSLPRHKGIKFSLKTEKGGSAMAGITGLEIFVSDMGHGDMSPVDYKNNGYAINDGRVKYFLRKIKTFPSFYLITVQNRLRFLQTCGIDFKKTFCPTLGLGNNLLVIDDNNYFKCQENGIFFRSRLRFDAVVTDISGLSLMFLPADCPVVILFDHQKKVLGKFHGGRENVLKNITGKTVRKMREKYSCRPENIIVSFPSPYLCEECHFLTFLGFNLLDPEVGKIEEAIFETVDGWKFDMRKAIEIQLRAEGVENIIPGKPTCTLCSSGNHFSHRGWQIGHPDHPQPGRFAVVTTMKVF